MYLHGLGSCQYIIRHIISKKKKKYEGKVRRTSRPSYWSKMSNLPTRTLAVLDTCTNLCIRVCTYIHTHTHIGNIYIYIYIYIYIQLTNITDFYKLLLTDTMCLVGLLSLRTETKWTLKTWTASMVTFYRFT